MRVIRKPAYPDINESGLAARSSQRVSGTRVFEAGGDAEKPYPPLLVLRLGAKRFALQPSPKVLGRSLLCFREHSTCFVDLVKANVAPREHGIWLYHSGFFIDRTQLPTNSLCVFFCAETRKSQHVVGLITAGVTWIQAQNLMTMFNGPLMVTYGCFQPCETPQHKHVIGIHFVGAPSIVERFWIAIYLGTIQNAPPSQRVAKGVRTVQFNGTRSRQGGFPKAIVTIFTPNEQHNSTSIGNCMQSQHAARVNLLGLVLPRKLPDLEALDLPWHVPAMHEPTPEGRFRRH